MKRRGRPPYPDLLTPREQEVLALLRKGLSNEQIAQRLDVSLAGAKYHVSEILGKLGVSTREEAARWEAGARPWWLGALAPIGSLRHRLGWAPQLAIGVAVVALAAGTGLVVWGLVRTNGSEPSASTVATLAAPAPPLVLATGRYGGMDWSADGKSLVFSPDGNPSIATAPDFVAKEMFPLASLATELVQPHWSPDGSRIAFLGSHPGRGGNPNDSSATIYVVNRDGSDFRDLLPGSAADLAPTNAKDVDDWLDNDTIVFYQGCGTACRQPFLLHVASGQVERAVQVPGVATGELGAGILGTTYYWSPDKRWIAADDAEGRNAIVVYDRQKQELISLATPPAGFDQETFQGLWQVFDAWSPDSSAFIYEQYGGAVDGGPAVPRSLRLHDISTGSDEEIAKVGIKGTWSPDGKQIAYVAAEFPDSACGGAGDATTCVAVIDTASGDELFRAGPAAYQFESQNTYIMGPLLLSGRRVVYAAPDGSLRLSNGASEMVLATPQNAVALEGSPDSAYIAVAEAGVSGRFMLIALDASRAPVPTSTPQ